MHDEKNGARVESSTLTEHGDLPRPATNLFHRCPKCGGEMECDMVDNGVGMEQCGPYGCPYCYYVEERVTLIDSPGMSEKP